MSTTGVLFRLSMEALHSAAALGVHDAATLFEHLYTYNSVPITRAWEQRFADPAAVRNELGLLRGTELSTLLASHWISMPGEDGSGWLTWVRRSHSEGLGGSGAEFKLYLSPEVEDLPAAFAALVETLSYGHAICFKVGADAPGLLRPDKSIAYFRTIGDLAASARQLDGRLAGLQAHGVPFTAEISCDGLMSWGVDPPVRGHVLGGRAPSWREWVCYQLAAALIEAMEEDDGVEPPWRRALEKLRCKGVQVERWLPSPTSWGGAS